MSKVAAMSLFRDSSKAYIDEYFDRARSLIGPHEIDFFLVEGDSKNATFEMLNEAATGDDSFKVFKNDTGLPQMGSAVHETRFKCLTRTSNPTIDVIANLEYDYFWFIDSDLLYPPEIVNRLVSSGKDVASPIIMAGKAFYDIWAFRNLKGNSIGPHTEWIKTSDPVQLSSVGGCVMVKHEFIRRGARMSESESIVGLCKECTDLGATAWMDTTSTVFHPSGVRGGFSANLARYGSPEKPKGLFEFKPTQKVIDGAMNAMSLLILDIVWSTIIRDKIRSRMPDIRTVLYGLAANMKPRRYLEIGVRRGHSMAMVAHAHPKCDIVGFDAWIKNYAGSNNPGPDFVRDEMSRVGHTGKLRLVSGLTQDTLKGQARGKFDLILVDGDHSLEGTIADLDVCMRHMSDKCVLVIDDLHDPQVRGAWDYAKSIKPDGFEAVELSNEIGVIKPAH